MKAGGGDKAIDCPNCRSGEFKVLFQRTRSGRIVRCGGCGLVRADPRAYAADPSASGRECLEDKILEGRWTGINALDRLELVRRVTGLTPGSLLDVGSYAGFFLQAATGAGWDAVGLEPLEAPVEYGRRELGARIEHGTAEEAEFEPGTFDLITFNHSLEHMDDPGSTIARCSEWLKPGGALFVETPDFRNPWIGLLGSRWRQFIRDHYFFFEPDTLRDLLARRGLRTRHLSNAAKALSLNLLADRVGRYYWGAAGRAMSVIFRNLRLDSRTIRLNLRDIMVAVAVKE